VTDFIEKFVSLTDTGLSPESYRRWTALVLVAAILDRRVYTSIRPGLILFPNLYVLLVGPSGRGKTPPIIAARDLLETQPHVGLAPDYTSYQAFIKALADRAAMVDQEEAMPRRRATMTLMLSEWAAFMNKPDNAHLAIMSHVFDCNDFKADVLCRELNNAENLYVNICAGVVEDWFAEGMPATSFKQGFMQRVLLIFEPALPAGKDSTPPYECSLDADPEVARHKFIEKMWPHLEKLAAVRGFVPWAPEALAEFNTWKEAGWPPVPEDTMLEGYTTRRDLFVGKIALLHAVSRHPGEQTILLKDYQDAKKILLVAEINMPRALTAAGGNIYQLRMLAIASYVEKRYIQTKRYVPEWEVCQRLGNLVPPHLLRTILNEMINQQMIRSLEGTKAPHRKLSPGITQ